MNYQPEPRHPLTGQLWPEKPEEMWDRVDFHPNAPMPHEYGLTPFTDPEDPQWTCYRDACRAYLESEEGQTREEMYVQHLARLEAKHIEGIEKAIKALSPEQFMQIVEGSLERVEIAAEQLQGKRIPQPGDDEFNLNVLNTVMVHETLLQEIVTLSRFVALRGEPSDRLRSLVESRLGIVRRYVEPSDELNEVIEGALLAATPIDLDNLSSF